MESGPIVSFKNVTFKYPGGTITPKGINLAIPKGAIYGFLGPNGSGKTTSLKLLLGLLSPAGGTITRYDCTDTTALYERAGAMVEEPSLYPHLTARQNLVLTARLRGYSHTRVEEVLDITNMLTNADRKVRGFSTGMKQRTALAQALIHEPDLLVLDEPGNGLDPHGIIDLRELIKKLNRQSDVTVIFSSHQLSEVQKLCTHIGLINEGNILYEGPTEGLLAMQNEMGGVSLRVSNPARALTLFSDRGIIAEQQESYLFVPTEADDEVAGLVRLLIENGLDLYDMKRQLPDLEALFTTLTK